MYRLLAELTTQQTSGPSKAALFLKVLIQPKNMRNSINLEFEKKVTGLLKFALKEILKLYRSDIPLPQVEKTGVFFSLLNLSL